MSTRSADAVRLPPIAALPRGLRDLEGGAIARRRDAARRVEEVYRLHGFQPLETPALERADAVGAFLPDADRLTSGVFGLRDGDGEALALRYDMTAPLARHVAERRKTMTFPFRRYTVGPVWRDEKPGPGRYREFWQCDADTVGAAVGIPDAEMCATLAAVLESLGIERDAYEIRLGNRLLLDGVLEAAGLGSEDDAPNHVPDAQAAATRLAAFRAVDKLDRLGPTGVEALLGAGRKDESGDYTQGAGLLPDQVDRVMAYVESGSADPARTLQALGGIVGSSARGRRGIEELEQVLELLDSFPCGAAPARVDPTVVRGLAYYTGPVFEAALTFEVRDEKGRPRQFGSVAGGGRYDGLVRRFGGAEVPATGVSLGIDRLIAALESRAGERYAAQGPVVVLVMGNPGASQRAAGELRAAGVAAEAFPTTGGMRRQMRYADRRGSPVVVIEGDEERAAGIVQLKDLRLGSRIASEIRTRAEWTEHPAQETVPRQELVAAVRRMLDRREFPSNSGAG